MSRRTPHRFTGLLLCSLAWGCSEQKEAAIVKAPTPVSVIRLKTIDPSHSRRLAGSVASWKTEAIGFEVEGRVQFVSEPGTEIHATRYSPDGTIAEPGTVLARIDPTRYEIHKASLDAQVKQVEQERTALQIEIDKVIPAQIRAARAARNYADIEVKRNRTLSEQGAGAVRALDRAKASLDESEAKLLEITARKESKKAEVESLTSRLTQLAQEVKEAERDIASCHLTSPYRGQIAEAHIIPGAYARRAERVVTVQMMDPIQIEFEVSAKTRHRLNYLDTVPIEIPLADGTTHEATAMVYLTDPVADPETRTFTVQMLSRNRQLDASLPAELRDESLARTSRIWWMIDDETGLTKRVFLEQHSIHRDAEGPFLFRVKNQTFGSGVTDPRLEVEKVRVELGEATRSFLGLYTFQEIVSLDGDRDIEARRDLFTGEVQLPRGATIESWTGDTVVLTDRKWALQPGDLVHVYLRSGTLPKGFYVPLSAIVERSGRHYLFLVSDDGTSARRVEVQVKEKFETRRRVEGQGLAEGARVVTDGAQFISDGAKVRVAKEIGE